MTKVNDPQRAVSNCGRDICAAFVGFSYLAKKYPEIMNEIMNVKINDKSISNYFDTPEKMIDFLELIVDSTDFVDDYMNAWGPNCFQ